MKKLLSILALLMAPLFISAAEKAASPTVNTKPMIYTRIGINNPLLKNTHIAAPSVGIGCRVASGNGAFDLYMGWWQKIQNDRQVWSVTAPRINYLHYFSAQEDQSLYAGGGFGFSGIFTSKYHTFTGITTNASVGYEYNRWQTWKAFAQIDITQPIIKVSHCNTIGKIGPCAELAFGGGF